MKEKIEIKVQSNSEHFFESVKKRIFDIVKPLFFILILIALLYFLFYFALFLILFSGLTYLINSIRRMNN